MRLTTHRSALSSNDLATHPAALAWSELDGTSGPPQRIEILKEPRGRPTGVYRLLLTTPSGSIIAKRCSLDDGAHEQRLYEQVLPHLPLTSPRYYGYVSDATRQVGWLFLEDAGDEWYSPLIQSHRTLAAEWLALLHSMGGDVAKTIPLPDRGVRWYRARLQSARALLDAGLNGGTVGGPEAARLERVAAWCDAVDVRWAERTTFSDRIPCTLVHADFVGENVRVRDEHDSRALLPYDWGTAGWGPPARDLVGVDIRRYYETARDRWSDVGEQELRRLAAVGRLFRRIAAVHRACMSLPYAPAHKVLSDMQFLAVRA